MKKNILIIAALIISLLGPFTLKAHSQTAVYGSNEGNTSTIITVRDSSILIGDETTIIYTKTMAKIECDNESIAKLISLNFDQIIIRFSWTKKTDRNGKYKHYLIYLNKDDAQYVVKWAKVNL